MLVKISKYKIIGNWQNYWDYDLAGIFLSVNHIWPLIFLDLIFLDDFNGHLPDV